MVWILFLTVVGLLLVCMEVFLPGMVVGSMGVLALLGAVLMTFVEYGASAGGMALAILIAASVVGIILWTYIFPKTPFGNKLITTRELTDCSTVETRTDLMGREGVTLTTLRPAGVARLGEERVDVVAESGFIEKDLAIRVVEVEGARVVVRKIGVDASTDQ
jgi:membrane-bound serine protease (ClpP class)